MYMELNTKRAYDKPEKSDGVRVLADRLWPRGVSKEEAKIDDWIKPLTPSSELRAWYHADKEKHFKEFTKKYSDELKDKKDLRDSFREKYDAKTVTLISANKDLVRSHIPTLVRFLKR